VVATRHGAVVGTAKMGPNRPGRGSHVGTGSVMVDPAAAGHGVGRALGEAIVEWAMQAGCRGIQFNAVVETNERARALWRSLCFVEVGRVPGAYYERDRGYVDLLILYRALS